MKKRPANPITPAASDAFALYMRNWQERFNLRHWRILRSTKAAGKGNMAEISAIDTEAMLATYRIGADFGAEPVTDRSLERIACHESAHVLLASLIEICRDARATDEQVNGAEHALINVLVDLLVPEN
jgi:hypothetical protein